MATPEQLKKAREKALLSPRHGRRGRSWKTIAKEKAREAYLKKLEEGYFDKITDVQMKAASKEKNHKERMFVVSQVIGSPPDKLEITGEDGGPIKIEANVLSMIDKIYGNKQGD